MREGYKKTEVGVIPENWEVKQLDDISNITRLAGAEYSDLWQTSLDGEIIALRGFNIGANKIYLNDVERISSELSNRLIRSKLFKGDIVFPCVGTIGKAAVINTDNKYHINQNIAKITPYKSIYSLYLSYFLISKIVQKQIYKYNTSSSQPNVLVGNLRKFNITVPPLKEQEKIAEILSTIDLQIDDTEKLIEKSMELKKGLMQKLLTKGIGHSEFKKTEIGEIPDSWEVKKLGDIGDAIIGLTYSPEDLVEDDKNGILVLRSSNISENSLVFNDNRYVNKNIPEKLITRNGDILICSRNGSKSLIGKSAYIDCKSEGSSFGAFMTIYRSKYNKFLIHLFNSYIIKRQIFNNLGATINQITTANLKSFKVPFPPIEEQIKIGKILYEFDAKIEEYQKEKQKLEDLKKGLMQQLLTGKIRTII